LDNKVFDIIDARCSHEDSQAIRHIDELELCRNSL